MSGPRHLVESESGPTPPPSFNHGVTAELDALPVAACLLDERINLLHANAAWFQLLTCSDASSSAAWTNRIAADDRETTLARLIDATRIAVPVKFAFRLAGAEPARWIEVSATARSEGAPLLALMRDATVEHTLAGERNAALHALDLTREQLERIFVVATDALLLVDCETLSILKANPAAGRLYGCESEDLHGQSICDLSADSGQAGTLIRSRCDRASTRFRRRHDGSYFPAEIVARYFEREGREVAVLAICDLTGHAQQERAQIESELKYRAVFDAAPYPIFLLNAQATVFDANPCAVDLYGYPREEILRVPVARLIDDVAQVESLFQTRREFLPAATHRRRDGTTFLAEATVSYIRLRNQLLAIAVVRDITEERRTLDRLQEAEERWRFALEGAGDGVWDWNLTTNDFYHSPRWREMLGYPADATDLRWNTLLHADDKHFVFGNLDTYLHGDSPVYEAEFRLRCADGSYKWIAARGKTMARDSSGRALRMLGTHRDITESRRMMETLRASEQRWQFALEGHGDGLWDWNLVSGRVTLSLQFKQILGYLPEDLEHSVGLGELIHPDESKRTREAFNSHLAGHAPLLSVETRLRTREGIYRWVALRGKVMEYGSFNRPTRMIGTLRDIQELKQREEWERRQHEQLAHAARLITLGEMASALAHELNQPLTAIRNFSGLGLRRLGESTPDGVRKTLEIIGEQSMRAGEIVRRVRSFVSKGETALVAVQINKVVEDMVRLVQMDARAAEVQVVLELQCDLPTVMGDRVGLEQVVMNLLKNGIEAMTAIHSERRLTVHTALRPDASIECSVTDFGEGVADKVMSMLFEPFVTTKQNGMGLGLSICRTIIENHRGRLWVEPTEGRGASFHFSVPIEVEGRHG